MASTDLSVTGDRDLDRRKPGQGIDPQADRGGEQPAVLAKLLNYEFSDSSLLRRALTHPSAAAKRKAGANDSYERLEFLGDRVLGLIVADMLLRRFPKESEGALARRHTALVRRETLAEVAGDLQISRFLRLAKGEDEAGERNNPAILADACEAVIGALYLDGGLEIARRTVVSALEPYLNSAGKPPQDAKTALQEWAQARGLPLPQYREIDRKGPPHQPIFSIEVSVEGHPPENGEGRSKRISEQSAAQTLLKRLAAGGQDDG
ncbi:ribonuclease III [Pelagibius sp. Alg239-R121]|uniref:ribonuclease III n=1 Tax=Pelagibius sp. Alg239-R121 TaxID=2993448 RepID=UPI0024A67BB6|nr:ribonuclease III [Pelagibius sp. Alg239-R121]